MLRYKTKTRPGLVALYNIRPGNGAGQFLQPQSPHGAPSAGAINTRGWEKLAIFDGNHCLSRKRCETGR